MKRSLRHCRDQKPRYTEYRLVHHCRRLGSVVVLSSIDHRPVALKEVVDLDKNDVSPAMIQVEYGMVSFGWAVAPIKGIKWIQSAIKLLSLLSIWGNIDLVVLVLVAAPKFQQLLSSHLK